MGNQLKVYVLQNTPLIELNGERIELSSMIQDFFVYLAVENKRSYARKYLGNLLFQPHGPDYLRTAVIGKIDKRIKDICLPESGRGNLLYESSYVWVDALEFADLVKEGLSLYQTPRQETVLLQAGTLYEDNFLAEYQFYWTDWHKTQQRRFLKSFASMAEALIRYYIIVRKPELAVPYAEQWQIRQPDNYLPIQYLIWLSVTLKRKNDIDYHIDQLDQLARNSHTFTLGLTPQEWYQLIREKKEATFDILDIEIEEIHPRDLIETVPPPSSNIQVQSNEPDIRDLISHAKSNMDKGYYDDAQNNLQLAEELSMQVDESGRISEIYHQRGVLHIKKGQYAEADQWLEEALKHPYRVPYEENESKILANLGASALSQGQYDRAREVLLQSYDVAENNGEVVVKGYSQLALAYAASETNNNDLAFVHFQQALDAFGESYLSQKAYTYFNMSQLLYENNRFVGATKYMNKGGALANQSGSPELLAVWYWCQGAIKTAQGDLSSAEVALRIAMEIAYDIGHTRLEGAVHTELGKVYLCRNDWSNAKRTFRQVLIYSLQKNNAENAAKALYGLALAILAEEFPVGRDNPVFSFDYLKRRLSPDILDRAANLPITQHDLEIVERVFEFGIYVFTDIKRYWITHALVCLLNERRNGEH